MHMYVYVEQPQHEYMEYFIFYLQTDDKRMSDFAQNIPLVLDMLDLLETNDFGHGQNLHGTVLFRNAITA